MKRFLSAFLFATLATTAHAEPVIVPTTAAVSETVERLKASVESAAGQIFVS